MADYRRNIQNDDAIDANDDDLVGRADQAEDDEFEDADELEDIDEEDME